MQILKKYCLIDGMLLLLAWRKVCNAVRSKLFYVILALVLLTAILTAVSSILTPTTSSLLSNAALMQDNESFGLLLSSFYSNASILTSLIYVFWGFFNTRDTNNEDMLALYGLSQHGRNLIHKLNTALFIAILSCLFYFLLVLPGLITSALVAELKIFIAASLILQIVFITLVISSIDAIVCIILSHIKAPLINALRLLLLVAGCASYIASYFMQLSTASGISSDIFLPLSLSSMVALACIPGTGVEATQALIALGVFLGIAAFFYVISRFDSPLASQKHNLRFLSFLKFSRGISSLYTKTIKELMRNKEHFGNFCCILLILLALKLFYPSAFEIDALTLLTALPATNVLYLACNDYTFSWLYKVRGVAGVQVALRSLLASLCIIFLESLILTLFFSPEKIAASLMSIFAGGVFGVGWFYLLGVLFPVDKNHPFSTPLIIALLVIVMIPITLLIMQFAATVGLDMHFIALIYATFGVLAATIGIYCFDRRLKNEGLQ